MLLRAEVRGLAFLSGLSAHNPSPELEDAFLEQTGPALADWEYPGEAVTGLEGASLRSCHRGRLLALLFHIAP
jgi:hypothetical protein